jgi:hypothetical protein
LAPRDKTVDENASDTTCDEDFALAHTNLPLNTYWKLQKILDSHVSFSNPLVNPSPDTHHELSW